MKEIRQFIIDKEQGKPLEAKIIRRMEII
jgi:hypothetical protein